MPKYCIAFLVSVLCSSALAENAKPWTIYSNADFFAYSAPVSIDQFASDFNDDLESGDTAFTHDRFEIGGKWRGFRLGYVHRFDYVTEFTDDTALYHHSEKNNIPLAQNRRYDLLLDVERVEAKGFEVGYEWNFYKGMTVDVSYSYYTDLSELQSGSAAVLGDLTPFTDQFKADANAILDTISLTNRDLSPLLTLAQNVEANLAIDYAYNEPKFREPQYREPVITGAQNPVISGVSFAEPSGTGYSVDIGFNWQINDQLNVNLELIDIANEFNWDNAPRTITTFDLNAFLIDAINLAQNLVDGQIVQPNDLIDDHINVQIFNEDFDQELESRYDLEVNYDTNYEVELFGWSPSVGLSAGYYKTDTEDFPRIGINLDRMLFLGYDIGGEAISLGYEGKYGFLRVVSDDFGFKDARTFGIVAGLNYSF
tara:strand:- start:12420 stop:13697 length:1278 start_codon:yes stop_codon:yes gene_type:complete